jgi:hypothetical protein
VGRKVDLTLLHAAISERRSYGHALVYPSGTVLRTLTDVKSFDLRGERGDINGFSAMSRRRLMERVIRLDWTAQQAFFITLTYPAVYPDNPKTWKENLHAFRTWIFRQAVDTDAWVLWRMEFQRRGAPHFHLVAGIRLGTDLSNLRDRVRVEWSRLVGLSASPGNFARVDVQQVRIDGPDGTARLLQYLCKYVAKRQPARHPIDPETGEISNTGRMWGAWGEVPLAHPYQVKLSADDYVHYCRRVRRWGKRNPFLARVSVSQRSLLLYAPAEVSRQLLRGIANPAPSYDTRQGTDARPSEGRAEISGR